MDPHRIPWLSYGCLAASMALVGSYVGLSKMLVAVFPVFVLAGFRFGIAAVAMTGWVRRAPGEVPLSAHDRRLLFLDSFLGNFLFSVCMLFGVTLTSALAAGVIMASLPGAVALLSRIVLRERIAPRVAGGIACAVGGIVLVAFSKSVGDAGTAGHGSIWGDLLLVAAVTCEASYVVIGKLLSDRVSPKRISALINLWGLALVAPLAIWQGLRFDASAVTTPSWLLLVFYSIAASVVTVWLWMTGLRHVPASQAGVFTVFLPISAGAVGVLAVGEAFSSAQAGAFALALLGVLLSTWPARRA